ncbi:hypothetical protein H0H87_004243 [Tephrocybe sp. NHM501043]|nr:hypothetical protein H0H87_004243 [Tephrocybe sp. NHM501043]
MPVFAPAQTLSFRATDEKDCNEVLLDTPGIEKIHFEEEFSVKDEHLVAIVARPALCASLKSLSIGDSDTGYGGKITNDGVVSIANACPNLRILWLDAALKINDATLISCCEACSNLESLRVTGHDRCNGAIDGSTALESVATACTSVARAPFV